MWRTEIKPLSCDRRIPSPIYCTEIFLHAPPHREAVAAKMEKAADEIVKAFEAQMGEAMENLEKGEMAFDDLNGGLGWDRIQAGSLVHCTHC